MADLCISVYDSGRVREAFATGFDGLYVDFVGVVDAASVDVTRFISVYQSVTVTDAGIEFNEHLYTDPRPAISPRAPARTGYGVMNSALASDDLKSPARSLSARMGAVVVGLAEGRTGTGSVSVIEPLTCSVKFPARTGTGRMGAVLNATAPTRSVVFTITGSETSFSLNKTAPGRTLYATLGGGTNSFSLNKLAPGRKLSASIVSDGWMSLDSIMPPRTLVATITEGGGLITSNNLMAPAREGTGTINSYGFSLSCKRSPPVVTLIEVEVQKEVNDYVLQYGG